MEVNHRLNELKDKARALLLSPQGIEKRSKRPVEVEAVFGQLKSNNKFNRFTLRGLDKVNIEFGLMALGHNFRKWAGRLTEKLKNDSVLTISSAGRTTPSPWLVSRPANLRQQHKYLINKTLRVVMNW